MDNIYYISETKLAEIISKFVMPSGKYTIEKNDEFGEGENYWIIKNRKNSSRYLLVATYWHPKFEEEKKFYKKEGFKITAQIPRRIETLEVPEDKNDSIRKYLFYDLYAIFLIQ